MALFFHSIAILVMVECVCAALMCRLWLVWILSIWTGPLLPAFSIHLYVGLWSWLNAVDENFAFVGADFYALTSSSFLQPFNPMSCWSFLHCFLADRCRWQTASCRVVVLRWTLTNDSGMSVSFASFTASPAKQSFSMIFSRNILNSTGDPCRTPTVVREKSPTFRLVTQRWSLHRTTTWWLQSTGCRCCILLGHAVECCDTWWYSFVTASALHSPLL